MLKFLMNTAAAIFENFINTSTLRLLRYRIANTSCPLVNIPRRTNNYLLPTTLYNVHKVLIPQFVRDYSDSMRSFLYKIIQNRKMFSKSQRDSVIVCPLTKTFPWVDFLKNLKMKQMLFADE